MGARHFPDWMQDAQAALEAAVARAAGDHALAAGGAGGAARGAWRRMSVMPLWLPRGAAGVTNLAFPIILAPLIWAVAFFYACLEENLVRASLVIGAAVAGAGGVAAGDGG